MLYFKKYENEALKEWVVCVHGIGGSSTIFAKQIKELRRHFNLLLIDLRGHGKTGVIPAQEKYNFELLCGDILKTMDSLSIQKAKFIGVSLGTIMIRKLILMAPDRMEKCVLAGAITTYNKRINFWMRIGLSVKSVIPYMWLYALFAWILMPRRTHRFSRVMFIREAKKMNQKEFLRWFDLVHQIEPIHYELIRRETGVPCLYVMGEEDYMFLETVKKDIEKDQNAAMVTISDSGHVCNVDQSEAFNQITLEYFKSR